MACFDIYTLKIKSSPLVVVVQADILNGLETTVIVPFIEAYKLAKEEMPRLKPIIFFQGKDYILNTTDITVIKTAMLDKKNGSIDDQRHVVIDAMDFLFQGF